MADSWDLYRTEPAALSDHDGGTGSYPTRKSNQSYPSVMMPQRLNYWVDEVGFGWSHWKMMIAVSGMQMQDGAEVVLMSSILQALQEEWHFSNWIRGFLVSVPFVGVLLGSLIAGQLADGLGRRPAILISYIVMVLAGVLSAFANSVDTLVISRIFVGLAYGVVTPSTLALLLECTPSTKRNLVVAFILSMFSAGQLLVTTLLWWLMPDLRLHGNNWRWVSGLSIIPATACLPFAICLLRESPYYLLCHQRMDDLVTLLKDMARGNGTSENLARLDETAIMLADIPIDEDNRSFGGRLSGIFADRTGWVTAALCFLTFTGNFAFVGVSYMLPIALRQMAERGWDAAGGPSPALSLYLVTIAGVIGDALSCLVVIDNFPIGLRGVIVISAFVSALLSLSMITLDLATPVIGLLLAFLYNLLSQPFLSTVYIYIPHVYPAFCRTTGSGFCVSWGRIGAAVVPLAFEALGRVSDDMMHEQLPGNHIRTWPFSVLLASLFAVCTVVALPLPADVKHKSLDACAVQWLDYQQDLSDEKGALILPPTKA
ncbi:hypothetical protein FOL47_000156 [Perkinsus chesapeaki]|uniref:Major facilitator superfamily (MFS) profile domain-containing protein n=1 Tax=Perkinsus chesapeaki TaxID=330153 RepID=A0A7J6MME4_PERCH|nr:hypothetical protein FOL47_000156 [Perkinsus chesapeaki]